MSFVPRRGNWWRRAAVAGIASVSMGISGLAVQGAAADDTAPSPVPGTEHAAEPAKEVAPPHAEAPVEKPVEQPAPVDQPDPAQVEDAPVEEPATPAEPAPEPAPVDEAPAAPVEQTAATKPAVPSQAKVPSKPAAQAKPAVQKSTGSQVSNVRKGARSASATGTARSTANTAAASLPTTVVKFNPAVDGASLPLKQGTFQTRAHFGATGIWAKYHTGLDFSAASGTEVYAVVSGTVVKGSAGGWAGNYVAIQADDGSSTLYAHLSAKNVKPGDRVEAGELIGHVGQSGRAFGAHLHFEYYAPGATPGDVYRASHPLEYLRSLGLSV